MTDSGDTTSPGAYGTTPRGATRPDATPTGPVPAEKTRSRLRTGWHRRCGGRTAAVLSLVVATASGAMVGSVARPLTDVATASVVAHISVNQIWAQDALPDTSAPIAESSPIVASLPGGPAVVVGDRAGHVYAMNLATGSTVPGWPASTGGVPVDSTPSVAVTSSSGFDSVFVGVGNASTPSDGGYMALTSAGGTQWFTNVQNPSTDAAPAHAVQASMAVGDLEGGTDVVAGSLGEVAQAMNAVNGGMLAGYPWFQGDSSFATPALADVYGNGRTDVVEGGDSSAGSAYGQTYSNGGHLRVVLPTGNAFQNNPAGGVQCQYNTDQTVQSSPAVGQFLAGGGVGIVFGTGATYNGASTTDDLIAVNAHCGAQWVDKLDGVTTSSPALADVLGNGQLQVVEGTRSGTVWALNGSNGATLWHTSVGNQIIGSVVTADLGGGYQDVIVPTILGVQILDGKTGQVVGSLASNIGVQNSPLVTDDANGSVGITIAGYNTTNNNQGIVEHFEIPGTNGAGVDAAGAWPMFHHDPQLTGDAGTPGPQIQVPCSAPSSTPVGYDLVASDGGVFTFGNLPFCGSTGSLALAAPVVSMALSHDGGGYWLVASDGGIFAFDDAGYYGSMGGKPLTRPVVAMAPTPDGRGYWLVASDGGIFAFGDAGYYGSMGGVPLHKPVVGMAPDDATGGYWLVAADGGVFSFHAPFHGSTGNIALARPVVGMQALANGQGYRFVASDGGVFDFGASFYGSTGGIRLTRPVVGMSGF